MKNRILTIAIASALLVATHGLAQPGPKGPPPPPSGNKKERIEAMKVGFLTDQLQLTPDEAKVFWPVYEQYQDEQEKLRKDRRSNIKNARENIDEMSDADIEKVVDSEISFRQSELDLIKKYNPQFKKVLPIRKVAKLYRAEEEFKLELLRRLKEDGNGGPDRQRRGRR
ncbi:MAG: hypothetical protein ACKO1U_10005 [Bacteroidota bacterium]